MEKFKDTAKINKALEKGEVTCLDPESGYRYSLCAVCPNDGHECSLAYFEKDVGQDSKITRLSFHCVLCDTRFDASPDELFLY